MKSITITGRMGKDSVLRLTNEGKAVLSFSVAVDKGYGQNKTVIWFDCSLWGKRGENLAQYLLKGTKITAIGDFDMREHNGKTYPLVDVQTIEFDNPKASERQQSGEQQSIYQPHTGGGSFTQDMDDDIPFAPEWR